MSGMRGEVVVMKPAVGCGVREVREATSGRVVVLPRVWAVGEEDRLAAARLARPNTGLSSLRAARSGRNDSGRLNGPGREDSDGLPGSGRNELSRLLPQSSREDQQGEAALGQDSEVAFYRKYTEALLRRYQRLQMSTARVPSPMDREMFRGRMSHYKVQGIDDAVIFCVDVERCLGRLNGEDQRLVRRIAVQQYTMGEAAGLLGWSHRTCIVLYRRALDRLTRLCLQARLLEPGKELSRG